MYCVKIVDEMGNTFVFDCGDVKLALKTVREWLLTSESGETPIESVEITLR